MPEPSDNPSDNPSVVEASETRFRRPVVGDGRDMDDYRRQVADCYGPHANPFAYYQRLVTALLGMRDVAIRPLFEFADAVPEGQRVIGLRHDVDADPWTALECARFLARHGVCGSFYLLHTAPYYGDFVGDVFVRAPELKACLRGLIVAGCEIGVHNDALELFRRGYDGIAALATELAWARSHGAVIRGTIAHNSGPVYGAENYEIFSGRVLWPRDVTTSDGELVPLGSASERELGLSYEGTFAMPKVEPDAAAAAEFFADRASCDLRSQQWMRRYLVENPAVDWHIDAQAWLLGRDRWVVAGGSSAPDLFDWDGDLDSVLRFVDARPPGTRTVLVVHPEYVRGVAGRR